MSYLLYLLQVAYTFDAGPNACLYLLDSEVEEFLAVINEVFPPSENQTEYFRGIPVITKRIPEVI